MSENTESVKETQEVVEAKKFYQRFTISERVEHWIFITAFIVLGITGLVQRYSELQISQWVVAAVGGI
jgi:cytochrome b subunit of formate dehydrogenase